VGLNQAVSLLNVHNYLIWSMVKHWLKGCSIETQFDTSAIPAIGWKVQTPENVPQKEYGQAMSHDVRRLLAISHQELNLGFL